MSLFRETFGDFRRFGVALFGLGFWVSFTPHMVQLSWGRIQ